MQVSKMYLNARVTWCHDVGRPRCAEKEGCMGMIWLALISIVVYLYIIHACCIWLNWFYCVVLTHNLKLISVVSALFVQWPVSYPQKSRSLSWVWILGAWSGGVVICLFPWMVTYNCLLPFKVFLHLSNTRSFFWCVHVGVEVTLISLDSHIVSLFDVTWEYLIMYMTDQKSTFKSG